MKQEAKKLREIVEKAEEDLRQAQSNLRNLIQNCQHQYGETIYDPIYTPAYTIPGDKPGTMGVDWRGPVHVPAKTEDRWRRECESCGIVEYTTQTKQNVREEPQWPNQK